MFTNDQNSAGWQYPTEAMLNDIVKGDKPTLRIDALQLRRLKESGNKHWRTVETAHDIDAPEWLPSPSDSLRLPCLVSISVWSISEKGVARKAIYAHSEQATIVQRRNTGTSDYFDILLDQAFVVEVDKFFTVKETSTTGSRHWRRTVTVQYTLEVSIHCPDLDNSAELLSKMEARELSNYSGVSAKDSVLNAIYTDLPECPPQGSLMQLRRSRGHKKLVLLDYGTDLSMGWSRNSGSPLHCHNRTRLENRRQLPTPSDFETHNQYTIQYTYQEGTVTRAYTQDDLNCVWCQSMAEEDRSSRGYFDRLALPCKTLDRLRFHYMTCHDNFRFEVANIVNEGGRLMVMISFTLTDIYSSSTPAEKPAHEEYSWIAPDRPFDLSRHVAGDESWAGGSKAKAKRGVGRPAKLREDVIAGASVMPDTTASKKRPSLDEVLDLPAPKRKKHTVPDVDGVTFYHNLSKQQIKTGELLRESDDEIYDDRLAQSQQHNFTELGLSSSECDFHQMFNRHVDAEQPASAIFSREAIIRFARAHQNKLSDEGWRHAFEKKLRHLRAHGVIDAEVMAFCFDMQNSVSDMKADDARNREVVEVNEGANQSNHEDEFHDIIKETLQTATIRNDRERFATTPKTASLQPKKGHKYSGKGADKEIIENGRGRLRDGSGSKPFATPSSKIVSPEMHARTSVTPARDISQSKKEIRFKYEGGHFVRRKDDEVVRVSAQITNWRAGDTRATSGHGGNNHDVAPIAHWVIEYTRAGASQQPRSSTAYAFVKADAQKSADNVVAEDLDFGKFVESLRRDLSYDPSLDDLVCRGEDDVVDVKSERQWREVLRSWEAEESLLPLHFKVLRKRKPTDPRQGSTNGAFKPFPAHGRRAALESKRVPIENKLGMCICGEPAAGGKGCIACDNPDCERQDFHMTCVGLEKRAMGWKCAACSVDSSVS
ncbi:hypothetical protein LTR08_001085 [Meristemomyces frigidus]|nr:hypothetical protein LTR08_001085 [Meristemomyces frigidus]